MRRFPVPRGVAGWGIPIIVVIALLFGIAGILVSPAPVAAAEGLTRLNMKYYGPHTAQVDYRLINIRPQYLVDNPAHGFWGEYTGSYGSPSLLQNVAGMKAAGIKVIGYTTSGYEGRGSGGGQPLYMFTLDMLKKQITNMALLDRVDGVFIDEIDSYPNATQKYYLKQLSDLAHSLGIIIWGNTGVDNFDSWFFNEGGYDLMQSTEQWRGQALSAVQQAYASRISVTGFQYYYTAANAAQLTLDAWNKGIRLCYINNMEYVGIAPWFEQYVAQIRSYTGGIVGSTSTAPAPVPAPAPSPSPTPTIANPPPATGEITRSVAAGTDDGFSGTWAFASTATWYQAGSPGAGASYGSWYRFTGVAIPRGATVIEARLETVNGSWEAGTHLKIRAEKAPRPAVPVNTADHSGRARTSAGVDWDSGYSDWSWHSSPNFAAVVQELVNSYDYSSGGAIQILVDNDGSTGGSEHTGLTLEGGSPARLYIKYGGSSNTTPSPAPAPAPAPTPTPQPPASSGELTRAIASSSDDGYSGSWAFAPSASWYEAGSPGAGATYGAWFRFSGVAIPAGATILEARLDFISGSWASGTHLKIRAEKTLSPAAPTSFADHSRRIRTSAGADWDSGYADWSWHSSPNFAAVIQELVRSYDYSAGGVVQVFVEDDGSTSGSKHTGLMSESGYAPRLYIKYSR